MLAYVVLLESTAIVDRLTHIERLESNSSKKTRINYVLLMQIHQI